MFYLLRNLYGRNSFDTRKPGGKKMEEFLQQMKTVTLKQYKIAVDLKSQGVSFLWTGFLFHVEYQSQLGTLYVMGDGLELELQIDSKDVQKFDNNFGIQNKNIEAFFNVEEM